MFGWLLSMSNAGRVIRGVRRLTGMSETRSFGLTANGLKSCRSQSWMEFM